MLLLYRYCKFPPFLQCRDVVVAVPALAPEAAPVIVLSAPIAVGTTVTLFPQVSAGTSTALKKRSRPMQAIKKLVTSQQEIILDRLPEHRAEVEEKIQLKARPFLSKQIEKQYHVNAEFRDLTAKASVALEASEVG